jgi:hypothetical protein
LKRQLGTESTGPYLTVNVFDDSILYKKRVQAIYHIAHGTPLN